MSRRSRWRRSLLSVGRASVDLVGAELGALAEDLKSSGRVLSRSLVLLLLAAFFLFWALGALVCVAIVVLALWLPLWGAALAVLGALLVLTAMLGGLGWRRIRRLETPARTVKRRVANHALWLRSQNLSGSSGGDEGRLER